MLAGFPHYFLYFSPMEQDIRLQEQRFLSPLGIATFNTMQQAFIQAAQEQPNLMLLAPTGSGKTLAFLFPLIQQLDPNSRSTQALIIVPSRELALQIEQVFKALKTGFRVSTCYGGHAMKLEKNSLGELPEVVIGTPGRLSDHVNQGSLQTEAIHTLVLDEFDKSLQLASTSSCGIFLASCPRCAATCSPPPPPWSACLTSSPLLLPPC
ncbi:ATP-independent RNA helicase [Nitritalea halalkaliphila LW7]|uniref:ATP-independent RNA helicase n=1 Tax=Nitritalea halalkaliphila LW7 TaxID=1189621 RepID=I5BTY6_9BACT|nr:DEAD/DEAH box helicase [Nitritalea halalkaliphila]EIM73038.1 ATP-independent RNA helicase [Nitritalea halalkaliphila LW7]